MRFANKTAIITGGASGIGAATARRLVEEGAWVALVDSDPAALREMGASLGGACEGYETDVTDDAAVRRTFERILEQRGAVDVLLTSAGISLGQSLVDTEEPNWDRVFAVNVKGTWLWMRAVLPHMVERGRGAVVTVASQLAFAGGRNNAAYIASKGAIVSLTRTAALEHAEHGVRINSVAPGATETPLLARSMARQGDAEAARQRSRSRHAMQRLGRPDEIAAAIAHLASDEASFTTGVVMPVDGGWLVA